MSALNRIKPDNNSQKNLSLVLGGTQGKGNKSNKMQLGSYGYATAWSYETNSEPH